MPNASLTWDYDDSGPLPNKVEILRDDVVINTATSPITSYLDAVPGSVEEAVYKIRAINGEDVRESDPVTAYFNNLDRYNHYFRLQENTDDSVDTNFRLGCTSPVFGSFGINTISSSNISTYVQEDIHPALLLNSPEFTVEVKIKAGPQTSYVSIIELFPSSTSWALRCEYTTNCIYFIIGSTSYYSSIQVLDGNPHKIAVSASNGELRIYIDDVLDKTYTLITQPTYNYGYFYVGLRAQNNAYFNGEIRDLGISLQSLYG